ncbi:MAG TPA: phage holin family protein [Acidimicrobiales bacterium]|nr:phage holin family protein [Acidimicrobiales bacterium]
MKISSWRKWIRGVSIQRDLEEIRDLAVRYVKEETVQPLKDMGRFALYGALGSIFVGFGAMFLLLAVLRFLQEQFPVMNGTLSWLPYLIVAVLAVLVIALTAWRIMSGAAQRRLKSSK